MYLQSVPELIVRSPRHLGILFWGSFNQQESPGKDVKKESWRLVNAAKNGSVGLGWVGQQLISSAMRSINHSGSPCWSWVQRKDGITKYMCIKKKNVDTPPKHPI